MRINLFPIYVANVLLSLASFGILYINTAYLLQYGSIDFVNILYLLSAVGGTLLLFTAPFLIAKLGNYLVFASSTLVALVSFYLLSGNYGAQVVIASFLLSQSFLPTIGYMLDIYLEEHASGEGSTGRVRSWYLMLTNTIAVISPFFVGFVVSDGGFSNIYYFSSTFLALFLIVIYGIFRQSASTIPKVHHHKLGHLIKEPHIFMIVIINFLLQVFYGAMVLYLPLLLTQTVGFSWGTTGLLLSIMLLPFMLFVLPIGFLADTKIEERTLITGGLVLMGISTIGIFFLPTSGANIFIYWAVTLCMTRVGAVIVETATESYFFKQVDGKDASLISIFRSLRPFAFVIAPLFGLVLLPHISYGAFFLVIGSIILLSFRLPTFLKDTRKHDIPASHFYKRFLS